PKTPKPQATYNEIYNYTKRSMGDTPLSLLQQKYLRDQNEIYSSESEEELCYKDIPAHYLQTAEIIVPQTLEP
ncbi:MAG: hypothetical protein ACKO96_04115, partial [Flammeovirgaceae bacterium]